MTLEILREKMFNSKYEFSVEGLKEFEEDFVEVWENRFLESEEVYFLGRSVFNTATEYSSTMEEIESKLQQICYGVFGFDLKGYYELIEQAEEESALIEDPAFIPCEREDLSE